MKRILFAIKDSFPFGAAYAARTRALCKLMQICGYQTDILCDSVSDGDTGEYGNIYGLQGTYTGIKKLIQLPIDYASKLNMLLNTRQYCMVLSASMFDRFGMVYKTVRKHHIPLVLESCEWYDVRGFRRKKKDIRYWQFQYAFSHLYPKVDGVIAISRKLAEYYQSKGKNVIRIPGIHEVDKFVCRTGNKYDNEIRFVYSGSIFGGKEQFTELIIALSRIDCGNKMIRLNVYGPNEGEIKKSLDVAGVEALSIIKDQVTFYGMVPQSEMARIYAENDFGVFFRPDRRSSHAGFPTKLGEYLASGMPVITNDTGDISLILQNGVNGFILKKAGIEDIKECLQQCINLSDSEYHAMRIAARQSAEDLLDYHTYINEVGKWLKCLIIENSKDDK